MIFEKNFNMVNVDDKYNKIFICQVIVLGC